MTPLDILAGLILAFGAATATALGIIAAPLVRSARASRRRAR